MHLSARENPIHHCGVLSWQTQQQAGWNCLDAYQSKHRDGKHSRKSLVCTPFMAKHVEFWSRNRIHGRICQNSKVGIWFKEKTHNHEKPPSEHNNWMHTPNNRQHCMCLWSQWIVRRRSLVRHAGSNKFSVHATCHTSTQPTPVARTFSNSVYQQQWNRPTREGHNHGLDQHATDSSTQTTNSSLRTSFKLATNWLWCQPHWRHSAWGKVQHASRHAGASAA